MRVGGESTKTRTLRKLDTKKQGDVLELHTDLVLPRVPVCDDAPVDIVLQLCRRTDTRAGRLVSKLRRQERAFKVLSWTRLRSNRTGACWHDMNVGTNIREFLLCFVQFVLLLFSLFRGGKPGASVRRSVCPPSAAGVTFNRQWQLPIGSSSNSQENIDLTRLRCATQPNIALPQFGVYVSGSVGKVC
ncbi:MAG: hypothetical protein MHM6MM_007979 [Cercozoa sp. M6MM]